MQTGICQKKKNEKKKSKSVKSLGYMDEFFLPANDLPLFESCQQYVVSKLETVVK